MTILQELPLEKKLEILSDAAKYDVACTSSGSDRGGKAGSMGNTAACGICHSFAADGRCISLLKILYTNECVYDCKYCLNRRSNDTVRTSFTPEEVCGLTMQFYRRNEIEGLFLSSGVRRSPTETMEQIYLTIRLLREAYRFNGYIHVKAIPGADPEVIAAVGMLVDRMSTNLELPTAESLRRLAPNKTRETILKPMRQIQQGIVQSRLEGGLRPFALSGSAPEERDALEGLKTPEGSKASAGQGWFAPSVRSEPGLPVKGEPESLVKGGPELSMRREPELSMKGGSELFVKNGSGLPVKSEPELLVKGGPELPVARYDRFFAQPRAGRQLFVPAGQSTQMIVGATPESDYQVLSVAEALYRRFDLKRVFYSAYVALNDDSSLPALGTKPPLLREHRLYQADWLLRFYGFQAGELLSPERPNFNVFLDPKCEWALRHLEYFPVEINRAPYALLLRIPGVGVKSAKRILRARRSMKLDFAGLKRIGVVLKRAHYFITCNGKMMYPTKIDEDFIMRGLIDLDRKKNWEIAYGMSYRQLSLFDDQSMLGVRETC